VADSGPSVLGSPTHAVVGARDVERACAFLAAFGFRVVAGVLPPSAGDSLYGLRRGLAEATLRLGDPGSAWLRVVETPEDRDDLSPIDLGPLAVTLRTRALELSLRIAGRNGARVVSLATSATNAHGEVREAQVTGLDNLRLGFSEGANGVSPDLDGPTVHVGIAALSWAVRAIDPAEAFWTNEAGLVRALGGVRPGFPPDVLTPRGRQSREVRLVGSPAAHPSLVLVRPGSDAVHVCPTWPLRPGLHAAGFAVADLAVAMGCLPSVAWGPVVAVDTPAHPVARAVTGLAPDGVRMELWQEGARQ
jgi:hypothetical protein